MSPGSCDIYSIENEINLNMPPQFMNLSNSMSDDVSVSSQSNARNAAYDSPGEFLNPSFFTSNVVFTDDMAPNYAYFQEESYWKDDGEHRTRTEWNGSPQLPPKSEKSTPNKMNQSKNMTHHDLKCPAIKKEEPTKSGKKSKKNHSNPSQNQQSSEKRLKIQHAFQQSMEHLSSKFPSPSHENSNSETVCETVFKNSREFSLIKQLKIYEETDPNHYSNKGGIAFHDSIFHPIEDSGALKDLTSSPLTKPSSENVMCLNSKVPGIQDGLLIDLNQNAPSLSQELMRSCENGCEVSSSELGKAANGADTAFAQDSLCANSEGCPFQTLRSNNKDEADKTNDSTNCVHPNFQRVNTLDKLNEDKRISKRKIDSSKAFAGCKVSKDISDEAFSTLLELWKLKSPDEVNTTPAEYPGGVGDGSEHSTLCKICNKKEDMSNTLICDFCQNACHIRCLNYSISNPLSIDEWFCDSCEFYQVEKFLSSSADEEDVKCSVERNWLLQSKSTEKKRVRIGEDFQASVPEWTGSIETEDENEIKLKSGTLISEEEIIREYLQATEDLKNNVWPMGWTPAHPASSINHSTSEVTENWLQCRRVVVSAGDMRADGRVAKRTVECGKWRRAPLGVEADEDWECFCAVQWDPKHADCAVPQEIPTKVVFSRLKNNPSSMRRENEEKESWKSKFNELVNFKMENGHCHVPYHSSLGRWLQIQRNAFKKGSLTSEKKSKLDAHGVVLDAEEAKWEENFYFLTKHASNHTPSGEPPKITPEHLKNIPKLLFWLRSQKNVLRNSHDSDKAFTRILRLAQLGIHLDDI